MSGTSSKADVGKMVDIIESIIALAVYRSLRNLAVAILNHAVANRKYNNLTGNTMTSVTVGIWPENGEPEILTAEQELNLAGATRGTLPGGTAVPKDKAITFRVYGSGKVKRFWGKLLRDNFIPTDERYGVNKAVDFIMSFPIGTMKRPCLVVCTGTEYSYYLEAKKNLNVLSDTAQSSVISSLFKQSAVRL